MSIPTNHIPENEEDGFSKLKKRIAIKSQQGNGVTGIELKKNQLLSTFAAYILEHEKYFSYDGLFSAIEQFFKLDSILKSANKLELASKYYKSAKKCTTLKLSNESQLSKIQELQAKLEKNENLLLNKTNELIELRKENVDLGENFKLVEKENVDLLKKIESTEKENVDLDEKKKLAEKKKSKIKQFATNQQQLLSEMKSVAFESNIRAVEVENKVVALEKLLDQEKQCCKSEIDEHNKTKQLYQDSLNTIKELRDEIQIKDSRITEKDEVESRLVSMTEENHVLQTKLAARLARIDALNDESERTFNSRVEELTNATKKQITIYKAILSK